VKAVREADPSRLFIIDAGGMGTQPVMSVVDLGIGQSTRGYDPCG
jgi:hypothetical protein